MKPRNGVELVNAIERGDLSAQAALQSFVDTIEQLDASIKAFSHFDVKSARSTAQRASNGPLRGLPVGVKDNIDTASMPTAYGSPIYAGHRPVADAPLVSMIRLAGGVAIGKTVSTEFAFAHPGPTVNPRNPRHTPGGSSSGSAAAVAAGLVPFAVGTQTAGSVIRPASYCGVAGLKPSFGLLPTANIKCFSWSLDTPGLFASTISDLGYFASALTGRRFDLDGADNLGPRIGIVLTGAWGEAAQSMANAIERLAKRASQSGALIIELSLGSLFDDAYAAQFLIQDWEFSRSLEFEYQNFPEQLSTLLFDHLSSARAISADDYHSAQQTAREARRAFASVFANVDVLLTPSAEGPAPVGIETTGSAWINRLWTVLGVPCVNVPGMVDNDGMPLGVQVVAPFGADDLALRSAAWLERILMSEMEPG